MNDKERGQTTPVQGETQRRSPRMPHERDESAASQERGEPTAKEVGELGRKDLERGVRDTTKQEALEQTYDRVAGDDASRGQG